MNKQYKKLNVVLTARTEQEAEILLEKGYELYEAVKAPKKSAPKKTAPKKVDDPLEDDPFEEDPLEGE